MGAGADASRLGPIEAVRVFVTDLEAARRFYAGALGLAEVFAADGIAQYDTGQAKLLVEAVEPGDAEATALVGRFVGVSFTVADVRAVTASLAGAGVRITAPPEPQPWGGTLAHVADPDGNELTLVEYP